MIDLLKLISRNIIYIEYHYDALINIPSTFIFIFFHLTSIIYFQKMSELEKQL